MSVDRTASQAPHPPLGRTAPKFETMHMWYLAWCTHEASYCGLLVQSASANTCDMPHECMVPQGICVYMMHSHVFRFSFVLKGGLPKIASITYQSLGPR